MKMIPWKTGGLFAALVFLAALSTGCNGAKTVRQHADKKNMRFGVAVRPGDLLDASKADLIKENFNVLVTENTMKLQYLRPSKTFWNWSDVDTLVAFAKENKMKVRGHTFIWHQQNPAFIGGLTTREEALAVMKETITETLSRYKGVFSDYDVCNEVFNEDGTLRDTVWLRAIGTDYIDIAFKTAREADPGLKLILNDYNNEYAGSPKGDAFYEYVKGMVARGIPIDGVGFQLHMMAQQPIQEEALRANIARFRELGLSVVFTEVDVRIKLPVTPEKEAEQTEVYAKLMEIALDEPNVNYVVLWGYTDSQSWIPAAFGGFGSAHLFTGDNKPKPVFTTVTDLIKAR